MPLEEDRITNLLYLVSQIQSITISDKTSYDKQRTILQMAQIGLLRHTGSATYVLDTLGQQIVDSKKSYTQYLEFQANKNNEPPTEGAPANANTRRVKFVKAFLFVLSAVAAGVIIYWLIFGDN